MAWRLRLSPRDFGLPCVVFMGETDIERQKPNVFRMRLLGAEVRPVVSGAAHAEGRDERGPSRLGHQCRRTPSTSSARSPGLTPIPAMVRDFQSRHRPGSARANEVGRGQVAGHAYGAIGGGSNAMGLFHAFLDDRAVKMLGVEAAGRGLDDAERALRASNGGKPGVLHGNRTYLLQNDDGQILDGHSISAGLDYPGVGPEHPS